VDELVAQLIREHDRAYRAAWLILRDRDQAEEAVQEALLRVWRFRNALPDGDGLRPWLYRVVVNTSLSMLRHDRPRRTAEQAESTLAAPDPGASLDPAVVAELSERAATIAAAVAELPEHLRVVVVLRYWVDLSEREIATAIKRRPGTVKSRLHDARTRLSAALESTTRTADADG
jgi:RNA polymerase sigma-70 factor (ECF subfamily)